MVNRIDHHSFSEWRQIVMMGSLYLLLVHSNVAYYMRMSPLIIWWAGAHHPSEERKNFLSPLEDLWSVTSMLLMLSIVHLFHLMVPILLQKSPKQRRLHKMNLPFKIQLNIMNL
uniref:Uncharacterized protein n=1 Tax=Opuntia streptacantha TaxID=393608 RepID=A0A7C8ZRK4_OPUST